MKTFGATELASANPAAFISASLPGLTLNFAPSATRRWRPPRGGPSITSASR